MSAQETESWQFVSFVFSRENFQDFWNFPTRKGKESRFGARQDQEFLILVRKLNCTPVKRHQNTHAAENILDIFSISPPLQTKSFFYSWGHKMPRIFHSDMCTWYTFTYNLYGDGGIDGGNDALNRFFTIFHDFPRYSMILHDLLPPPPDRRGLLLLLLRPSSSIH